MSMLVVKKLLLFSKAFPLPFDRQFQFETALTITADHLCLVSRPLYIVV